MLEMVRRFTGQRRMLKQPFPTLLGEALYTERQLLEILPQLIAETTDEQLRRALEEHLQRTRRHVLNVQRIFDAFGARPYSGHAPVVDSLRADHDALSSQTPRALADLSVAMAAVATEHFEIAMYEAMTQMVTAIGRRDVLRLINENLNDERQALAEAQEAMRRLARDHVGDLAA
jgi:ferritin-like metal-binding protein YciE